MGVSSAILLAFDNVAYLDLPLFCLSVPLPIPAQVPSINTWLNPNTSICSPWTKRLSKISCSTPATLSDMQAFPLSDCLARFAGCQTRGHTYRSPWGGHSATPSTRYSAVLLPLPPSPSPANNQNHFETGPRVGLAAALNPTPVFSPSV